MQKRRFIDILFCSHKDVSLQVSSPSGWLHGHHLHISSNFCLLRACLFWMQGCVRRLRRNVQVRWSSCRRQKTWLLSPCPSDKIRGKSPAMRTCSCIICVTHIVKTRSTSKEKKGKLTLSSGKKCLANHSEAFQTIFLFILKTFLFLTSISHQRKYLKFLRSTVTFCFVNKRLTYSAIAVFVICFLIQWKSDDRSCQAVINSFSITVQALEWFILCRVFGKNGIYLNCFSNKRKSLN